MKRDNWQIIHLGLNYVLSPTPQVDATTYLAIQQALVSQGVSLTGTQRRDAQLVITREGAFPLEITVGAPSASATGQLKIVASHPNRTLDAFISDCEAVRLACEQVWPAFGRRILRADAAMRVLFASSQQHAFQELWETWLGQPRDALQAFGRPILGGGFRLVMPPVADESEPTEVEVKIESYLRDATKLFVETQFVWPQPAQELKPQARLGQVNSFLIERVLRFAEERTG